ncbi:zeta toxin family protein [Pseudomonas sp. NFR16]|uniref:zeta toxin family protein n=1 Tax=Pseudomonas sp. NFR16 TaxID=1566248 RepID=UPI0008D2A5D9|nr:zeta toxin family protein [Pseudomonas sp. NFR16]SEI98363.1 Zeta toxin [Pseudomonas sp. NFR16]
MSASRFSYTPAELNAVYSKLENKLFNVRRDIDADGQPAPKILVVAGVQGSGKTYMLNNHLLKDARYANFVRLYSEDLRELHPRYVEFANQDVTRRYMHTESFIWELCSLIFAHAHQNKYNIILETALDTKAFATLITGPELADYQFDVHLIACKKDFVHLSTVKRAFNALESGSLERFVDIATIEASIENAEVILNAFETACMRVSGSTISMYERGFGALKNRRMLCSSCCERINTLTPVVFTDESGATITVKEQTHRIERSEAFAQPCSYATFIALVEAPVTGEDRTHAWEEAYAALARLRRFWKQIPPRLPDSLWGYITRYAE